MYYKNVDNQILLYITLICLTLYGIYVSQMAMDNTYVPLVVGTSRSFPHSRLTTGFITRVTRYVLPVQQELHTLPEHLSSSSVFSEFSVAPSLAFYLAICRSFFLLLSFFFWPFIVLSVLLRFQDSDCSSGIFKL